MTAAFARQDSMYHRVLRVAAVVCALVLTFESGLVSPATVRISMDTHSYLANAVGMYASIEPTELNSMTAELTAQKRALDEREAALREREIAVDLGGSNNDTAIYVLASVLFILLMLIILNYVLDYLRVREQRTFIEKAV
jgi:hypothetical protein